MHMHMRMACMHAGRLEICVSDWTPMVECDNITNSKEYTGYQVGRLGGQKSEGAGQGSPAEATGAGGTQRLGHRRTPPLQGSGSWRLLGLCLTDADIHRYMV